MLLLFITLQPGVAISADTPQAPTVKDLIEEEAPTVKDLIEEEPKKEDKATPVSVTKAIPLDEFDRGTPRVPAYTIET
jgi:hypothetical protein